MARPRLRVQFVNFWPGFDPGRMPQDYFFEYALSRRFDVVYDATRPDVVFYSVFGAPPVRADFPGAPLLVAYSGEPVEAAGRPDLALGSDVRERAGYVRLPLWALYLIWDQADTPYRIGGQANLGQGSHARTGAADMMVEGATHPLRTSLIQRRCGSPSSKSRFCNFTYRNAVRSRIEFFELLSRYRCVDSTGPLLNNTGYLMRSKVHELSAYRYTIAFENTIRPGYVTEKLLEPLAAGSLPIYLGARDACADFNPDAFVHALDFEGPGALVEHIRRLDQDDVRYREMLSAPVFRSLPDYPGRVADAIAERLGGLGA